MGGYAATKSVLSIISPAYLTETQYDHRMTMQRPFNVHLMSSKRPPNGHLRVAIDQAILDQLDQIRPQYMDRTTFINMKLDAALTLGKPSRSLSSLSDDGEVLPLKAVNKEKDVEISLRAEEAHIPAKALKKVKPAKEVPGCLFPHEDLIRAYWKAKPKTKTDAAWNLLMRELTKIQDNYGDDVVRDQLVLAEAQRFQSITLKNFEQFGVKEANTPKQASGIDYAALDAIRTPW